MMPSRSKTEHNAASALQFVALDPAHLPAGCHNYYTVAKTFRNGKLVATHRSLTNDFCRNLRRCLGGRITMALSRP